jgi:hypothetical protein
LRTINGAVDIWLWVLLRELFPAFAANVPLLKGASLVGVFWSGFAAKEPTHNATNMQQLIQWLAKEKSNSRFIKRILCPKHRKPCKI